MWCMLGKFISAKAEKGGKQQGNWSGFVDSEACQCYLNLMKRGWGVGRRKPEVYCDMFYLLHSVDYFHCYYELLWATMAWSAENILGRYIFMLFQPQITEFLITRGCNKNSSKSCHVVCENGYSKLFSYWFTIQKFCWKDVTTFTKHFKTFSEGRSQIRQNVSVLWKWDKSNK